MVTLVAEDLIDLGNNNVVEYSIASGELVID